MKIFIFNVYTADTFTFSGFTHANYTTSDQKYQIVYSKKEKYIDQKIRNFEVLEDLKTVTQKMTVQECERLQGLPENTVTMFRIGNNIGLSGMASMFLR